MDIIDKYMYGSIYMNDEVLNYKLKELLAKYFYEFDTPEIRLEVESQVQSIIGSHISSNREDKINKILE